MYMNDLCALAREKLREGRHLSFLKGKKKGKNRRGPPVVTEEKEESICFHRKKGKM